MSSTVIAKNIQVGTSGTATNNFTWYQPAAPDGTIRLGVGNYGATTLDAITATSAGNVTISGSVTGGAGSFTTLAASSTVSGTGFSNYLASPPAIGGTVAAAGSFTTLNASTAVRSNTYQDASGGSNAVFSGVASPPNSMGFRNRILNGGMVIDQRNNGGNVTFDTSGTYIVDRWTQNNSGGATIVGARSTVAPSGFTNSLFVNVTSGGAPSAGQLRLFRQYIEGLNAADLAWGTASAQAVTVSFWVRSTATGTFACYVGNASFNRSQVQTFTVSAANTWEQKFVTFSGDTTGTWGTGNGIGVDLGFDVGSGTNFNATAGAWNAGFFTRTSGAVTLSSTTSANMYITGVQLEAGTVASPFERRDYGRELIMCQRYFYIFGAFNFGTNAVYNGYYGGSAAVLNVRYPVQMRATPTATVSQPTQVQYYSQGNVWTNTTITIQAYNSTSPNYNAGTTDITIGCASDSVGGGKLLYLVGGASTTLPTVSVSAEL